MRSRHRAAITAGLFLLFGGGCEDSTVSAPPSSTATEPTFRLAGRSFTVRSLRRASGLLEAEVRVQEPEGEVPRTVRVGLEGEAPAWTGFRAESRGPGLLFGMSVSWRRDDPNRMRFRVYDGDRSLRVERSFANGFLTEIYRFANRADTLRVRGPFDLLDPGAPEWDVPPGSQRETSLARAVSCADAVWLRLDENPEGARLGDLLWKTGFSAWLTSRIPADCRGESDPVPGAPQLVCLCWLGSGNNPLCGLGGSPGAFRAWTGVAQALECRRSQGRGEAMLSLRNRITLPSSVRTAIQSSPR